MNVVVIEHLNLLVWKQSMPFAVELCHVHLAVIVHYWLFDFLIFIEVLLAEYVLDTTQNLVLTPRR